MRLKKAGDPDTLFKGLHTDSLTNTYLVSSGGTATCKVTKKYRERQTCVDFNVRVAGRAAIIPVWHLPRV